MQRAPQGMGEVDPASGGFLFAPEYERKFLQSLYDAASILSLCTIIESSDGRPHKFPRIDETSRADNLRFGGVYSAWVDEGTQPPAGKPKAEMIELTPHKVMALAWASNELVADIDDLLSPFLERSFTGELSYRIEHAIVQGLGGGQPMGIIHSPATITVAKEVGQAGGTIVKENLDKLWDAIAYPLRSKAVWLIGEGVERQLNKINAANPGTFYYARPSETSADCYATLYGRPVIPTEHCPALGTPGDIICCELSTYVCLRNTGIAVSGHAGFSSDHSVFRAVARVDGAPLLGAPVTATDGTQRSAFSILAAR
ncbi:phage major capsid protein [Methylocystis sp. IM3]|uniref:phage major capsid protein n=1 Tax=unclassified Methylocystis TaxID=2625913 RepID=UPI0030F954B4